MGETYLESRLSAMRGSPNLIEHLGFPLDQPLHFATEETERAISSRFADELLPWFYAGKRRQRENGQAGRSGQYVFECENPLCARYQKPELILLDSHLEFYEEDRRVPVSWSAVAGASAVFDQDSGSSDRSNYSETQNEPRLSVKLKDGRTLSPRLHRVSDIWDVAILINYLHGARERTQTVALARPADTYEFSGLIYQVTGLAFASTGVLVSCGRLYGVRSITNPSFEIISVQIGSIVASAILVSIGSGLFIRGKRLRTKRTVDVNQSRSDRVVLYLRPFGEDEVEGKSATGSRIFPTLTTEEEEVSRSFRDIGQLVALGRPGEALPYVGASRVYVALLTS